MDQMPDLKEPSKVFLIYCQVRSFLLSYAELSIGMPYPWLKDQKSGGLIHRFGVLLTHGARLGGGLAAYHCIETQR